MTANIIRRRKSVAPDSLKLFVTTFQGLESVLARELSQIGATDIQVATRGASFSGSLETVYRANLWLRTAHRVLWQIGEFPAGDREALYESVREINWGAHLDTGTTIAVDTVGTNENLGHTQFTSRVVKDGVVDWFRDRDGTRPNVDTKNPDFRLNARIFGDRCVLSWDTSGERLNQRGYRSDYGGPAPLKENLAAGLLLLSGYTGDEPLVDPMCGSGTILIEGAMIAKNIAPGLLGRRFGLTRHPTYDSRLWSNVQADAKASQREIDGCPVIGFDISDDAIRAAKTAVAGAGVDDIVRLKRAPLKDMPPFDKGMLVTNPPYGERLGEMNRLAALYELIGSTLKHKCTGMSAHVITSSKLLSGKIGLRTQKRDVVWNGPLECRLLHYDMY